MPQHFDPKEYPDRVILIDMNIDPPAEFMNCLGCGRLVRELHKEDELCAACYRKWEKAFREHWVRVRFGSRA